MKSTVVKMISILLCAVMLAGSAVEAFAAETAVPENSYPYVFVHGMMGWGENTEGAMMNGPYWGFNADNDVPAYLRGLGYEVAVPSVGPMSSAWDRACELYAQLTGTRVDYGAAHSEAHGHARFGRDYTNRAVLNNGAGWDMTTPVNIVTHSFGGPTAIVFASVMEYGVPEEVDAAPGDCSEFFRGGKKGLVHSVSTLASPHNGSPLSNLLYDIKLPVFLAAFIMNVADNGTDYMFDQFGITEDPALGEKAKFNFGGIMALYKSDDHCAYDMTIKGARELVQRFPAASGTYYFSYSGDITEDGKLGRKVTKDFASGIFGITGSILTMCAGKRFNGVKLGAEWAANDGFVPVVSAMYPFGQQHTDYVPDAQLVPGVWYVMPTTPGGSHGYHVGGQAQTLHAFYDSMTAVVNAIG